MKINLTDFLVPIYGPINAFIRANEESGKNLDRTVCGEISNREFILNELDYTSYVLLCSAVSTLELYCIMDKLVR